MAPGAMTSDLCRPENLPGRPADVELLTTHISWVLRTPDDVYKIKRPVDLGFLDFTTLERRRHFCEEEVRLNRRLAPTTYLGTLPVHRDGEGHSMNRAGEVVDWAVHMHRLPDEDSAREIVRAGGLDAGDLEAIARHLGRFHREAPRLPPADTDLADNVAENDAQMRPLAGGTFGQDELEEVLAGMAAWLEKARPTLARRPAVEGHGDLRLEHVYLLEDGIEVIDCIEFLDRFRIADPALDAAFLAMDLGREGARERGEAFLGFWARATGDYGFYPVLDGYLAYRACVRAKVAAFVAADERTGAAVRRRKEGEAGEYLELARRLLEPPTGQARVVAVGGSIASGKSTLAAALATELGGVVVSADAVRKHGAGLDPEAPGGPELYRPEVTERTRDAMFACAAEALAAGRTVVLDTSFRSRALRARARRWAEEHRAPMAMVEVHVPEEVARQRLAGRGAGGMSDAREDLLPEFLASWEPIEDGELAPGAHLRIDGRTPTGSAVATVVEHLDRIR